MVHNHGQASVMATKKAAIVETSRLVVATILWANNCLIATLYVAYIDTLLVLPRKWYHTIRKGLNMFVQQFS